MLWRKRFRAEEIIAKMGQAVALVRQGTAVAAVAQIRGVSEVAYYRWRKECGGGQASRRRKEVGQKNARPSPT